MFLRTSTSEGSLESATFRDDLDVVCLGTSMKLLQFERRFGDKENHVSMCSLELIPLQLMK